MEAAVDAEDILDSPQAGPTAVRGAALRVAGYLAGTVLSVVSAAVVLRYLGVGSFGQYVTIFSLMTIVAGVTDAGTTSIGVREYAVRSAADRGRLIANLQGMRLALTAAGVVVAVLFALAAGYSDAQMLGTLLAGGGLLLTAAALTLLVPLQGELRLGAVTGLDLLRQALTTAVLLAMVTGGAGVAVLLGAPIPVGVVLVAAAAWAVRRSVPLNVAFDWDEWRALLRDTLPYAAATAIGVLYAYLTVVLMSLVATETETGVFGAAFRVFVVLTGVPGLLVASAFPVLARAARDDRTRLSYGVQRLVDMNILLGIGLALGTVAVAPLAIDVVAGDKYGDSVPVLRLHGVALLFTFFAALGGFALLSLRRHRELLVANALALVTSAVLVLTLADAAGAQGAAIANIAGEAVLGAAYFVALARAGVRPSAGVLPRVAFAGALAAIPYFALGLPTLAATLLGAAVFAGAAFVLRAVPREAIEAFTELLGNRRLRREEPPRTPPPPGSS